MKKTFLKNLLDRRVPQILGSYFIGSTTLIFFIDWLVAKYGFSDYYTSTNKKVQKQQALQIE